jgi:hypothetical protein
MIDRPKGLLLFGEIVVKGWGVRWREWDNRVPATNLGIQTLSSTMHIIDAQKKE